MTTQIAHICGYTPDAKCQLCGAGMDTTSLLIVREEGVISAGLVRGYPEVKIKKETIVCADCVAKLVNESCTQVCCGN